MAKTLAIIKYMFMFEPGASTWNRGSEFETDLAKFFASNNLQAEIIQTIGGSDDRVVVITSMDKLDQRRSGKQDLTPFKVGKK